MGLTTLENCELSKSCQKYLTSLLLKLLLLQMVMVVMLRQKSFAFVRVIHRLPDAQVGHQGHLVAVRRYRRPVLLQRLVGVAAYKRDKMPLKTVSIPEGALTMYSMGRIDEANR